VIIENHMDQHIEAHLRNVTDGHEPKISTRRFQEASEIATAAAKLTIKQLFEADEATKRLNKEDMLTKLQAHLEDATMDDLQWKRNRGNRGSNEVQGTMCGNRPLHTPGEGSTTLRESSENNQQHGR
jgi:hypothetical protein